MNTQPTIHAPLESPTPFPQDMRGIVLTASYIFGISAKIFIRKFIKMVLGITFLISAVYALCEQSYLIPDFLLFFLPVSGGITLLLLVYIYLRVRQSKHTDIVTAYGVTEEALFSHNVYSQSVIRWEYFLRWSEQSSCILLHDGARQIILPKQLWSAEEYDRIRGYLRAKVSPKSTLAPKPDTHA